MSRDAAALLLVVVAGLVTLLASRSAAELLGGLVLVCLVSLVALALYRYASR